MNSKDLRHTLINGLLSENPTFRLVLGMCPTMGVTTMAENGLGMGLATTAVLVCSNAAISLCRKLIPDRIRIPAFVIIIATFVTVVDLFLRAFIPSLSIALGAFIPLIVVNCIVFARAESYAFKNPPLSSAVDGLGMGLGFTCSITLLSCVRELLGMGTLFGLQVMPASYVPMAIMTAAPGGFITLGILMALFNTVYKRVSDARALKKEAACV